MSEQSSAGIFDRNGREPWEKQGSGDYVDVAHFRVAAILKNHASCGLDADVVNDLKFCEAERS